MGMIPPTQTHQLPVAKTRLEHEQLLLATPPSLRREATRGSFRVPGKLFHVLGFVFAVFLHLGVNLDYLDHLEIEALDGLDGDRRSRHY